VADLSPSGPRLLAIYLKDHLAGATIGRELALRAARSNEGSELGDFLRAFLAELEEDRGTLLSVMNRLGVKPSVFKVATAWLGEKLGRAKLNGQLTGYSPLSRVLELEALTMGVTGKLSMWRVLGPLAAEDPRLREFDFGALAERAERQRAGLEQQRKAAALLAFEPKA
jgi:hypothetical protein